MFIFLLLFIVFSTKTNADDDNLNIRITDNFKEEIRTKNLVKEKSESKTTSRETTHTTPKTYKNFIGNISAYTASADECGKSDGITASGKLVKENHTIACPKEYKFGTKIKIEGFGTYVCEDRGGAIKGNKFDIYMKTKTQAFAFGRRYLKVTINTIN